MVAILDNVKCINSVASRTVVKHAVPVLADIAKASRYITGIIAVGKKTEQSDDLQESRFKCANSIEKNE